MKQIRFRTYVAIVTAVALALIAGCGTIEEGTTGEDSWGGEAATISETALLEYRIDSLSQENRRLQQMLENSSAENRNLTARNNELEGGGGSRTSGGSTARGGTTTPSASSSINPGYESALSKFRTKQYQEAVDEFSSLLNSGISDDLADNCRYWIGESYFGLKRYNDAVQQFESVAALAGSDKADDAQLMLGNAYSAMGNKAAAKQAYQFFISNYPGSPLMKRARAKLNAL